MKVFITLTLFLIVVIFKTFVYNAKVVYVNVFVKPKCLCSNNEYVFTNLNTSEWQPNYKNLLCGYNFNMGQLPMQVSEIPKMTLSFNHSCEYNDEYLYIYNVSRDCTANFYIRDLSWYQNDGHNFLCDESKMKKRKPYWEEDSEEE